MICKALITGTSHKKGEKKSDGKPYDFWMVSVIDTENPAGTVMDMTLPKDDKNLPLPELIQTFDSSRMKIIPIHVFLNGNYTNFGGFVK